MAIQSQPSRIPEPFAGSGSKNTIPATNSTPSASQAASWASGFPPECSMPLNAGGCPVPRNDFNGTLNQITQDYAFRQDGGVWAWSASADYDLQRVVRGSDGLLYYSVAQSGPGVAAGAQDPTADMFHAYWSSIPVPTMPATDRSSAAATTAWVASWYSSIVLPSTIYVDAANGSDSNDGATAATALKTIGEAQDRIASPQYLSRSSVTIKLASGTYTGTVRGVFGKLITFSGPTSGSPASIPAFDVTEGRNVVISGRIATGSIIVSRCGTFRLANGTDLVFDASLAASSSNFAIFVFSGGVFTIFDGNSASISFTGTWNVAVATVRVRFNGTIALLGTITWSGSVTGTQYDVTASSSLSGIGGADVIPGTPSTGNVDSTSYFS